MFMGVVLLTKNLWLNYRAVCIHVHFQWLFCARISLLISTCLRELAYVEIISILLIVTLAWFLSIHSFLFTCTLASYKYVCVHVDIYIYGKIILPFFIFNMKHRYTKRKLVCQVVTHSTTPLSYVTSTFKIYENTDIYTIFFYKIRVCCYTVYAWNFTTCLLYVWQLIPVQCGQ